MHIPIQKMLIAFMASALLAIPAMASAPADHEKNVAIEEPKEQENNGNISPSETLAQMAAPKGTIAKLSQVAVNSIGSSVAGVRYVARSVKSGASVIAGLRGKIESFIRRPQQPKDIQGEQEDVDIEQLKKERNQLLKPLDVISDLNLQLALFIGDPDDESKFEKEIQEYVIASAPDYMEAIVKGLKKKWFNIAENGIYLEQEDLKDQSEVAVSHICSMDQYNQIVKNIDEAYADLCKNKLNAMRLAPEHKAEI